MKLLFKRGQNKTVHCVSERLYILKNDIKEYNENSSTVLYYEVNGCAVCLGYVQFSAIETLTLEFIESKFQIYKDNMLSSLNQESFNASHEVYTSSFKYLNKLYGVSVEKFDSFNLYYENHLENYRIECEEKHKEEIETARLAEIERIKSIKSKIIKNKHVSGRDVLDLMIVLDIKCPLRTKGLINRCDKINNVEANINGKKPSVSSTNNLFKWFKIVQDYLIECK